MLGCTAPPGLRRCLAVKYMGDAVNDWPNGITRSSWATRAIASLQAVDIRHVFLQ
jgi:hypothetical protein